MKMFLTIMVVVLVLFLVVTLGIFMPRLSNKILSKHHLTPTVTLANEGGGETTGNEVSPSTQRISIYLIALGDEGASGKKIGCGDSVVPVEQEIPQTREVLKATLTQLLTLKEKYYGESGLYNALSTSSLHIDSIETNEGTAVIKLAGTLSLGGVCDSPRFEEQLKATALQFPTITTATFYLNGVELHKALSEK